MLLLRDGKSERKIRIKGTERKRKSRKRQNVIGKKLAIADYKALKKKKALLPLSLSFSRTRAHTHTHAYIHTHTHIYIYT